MKYVKKPIIVDAIQWFKNGDDKRVIKLPETILFICEACNNEATAHGWLNTLEGGHVVCPGDYIITGVKGEVYPCKPDIFALTYEPLTDDKK